MATEPIPDHIAAYAAGLLTASNDVEKAAFFLRTFGLGDWSNEEIEEAATRWGAANISPGAIAWLRETVLGTKDGGKGVKKGSS